MRDDLKRMACLRGVGLSLREAIALGFGLDHAAVPIGRATRYNGAGLIGDRRAIEGDFAAAWRKLASSAAKRAG